MKALNGIFEFGKTMATPRLSILALRIAMGVMFLKAGLDKVTDGGWTATGFLLNATDGPFAGMLEAMANNGAVDNLVMWGEIAIGLALILGAATRWTALAGALMVGLFYISQLPPAHGWVTDRLVYFLALNLLAVVRAGTYFGIDGLLVATERRYPPLRYVLG